VAAHEEMRQPFVDLPTLAGLVLLLLPPLIMAHELGGHGATCLALGGQLTEIGAYYVACDSPNDTVRRLVSMAGTGADAIIFALGYWLWSRAKSDMMRLAMWVVFVGKGMAAMGYLMFSGISGIGDWGPGAGGGIGPLPQPLLIRGVEFAVGLFCYMKAITLGKKTMRDMVGGHPLASPARRTITLGYYWVTGLAALAVGAFNPKGLFVLLASAVASSFGGNAGIFSIVNDRTEGPPRAFAIPRNLPIIVAGVLVFAVFAIVLGRSIILR
jgi:hypothetical protein